MKPVSLVFNSQPTRKGCHISHLVLILKPDYIYYYKITHLLHETISQICSAVQEQATWLVTSIYHSIKCRVFFTSGSGGAVSGTHCRQKKKKSNLKIAANGLRPRQTRLKLHRLHH